MSLSYGSLRFIPVVVGDSGLAKDTGQQAYAYFGAVLIGDRLLVGSLRHKGMFADLNWSRPPKRPEFAGTNSAHDVWRGSATEVLRSH